MIPLGILAAAGAGDLSDYQLIETLSLGSGASSVTFSNLESQAANYRHLQLRIVARLNFPDVERTIGLRFNGVNTGGAYAGHGIFSSGSTVSSYGYSSDNFGISLGSFAANSAPASVFSPGVVDILDAFSTTKTKTVRSFAGTPTTPQVSLRSGLWNSTSLLTSITLIDPTSNIAAGSRFSLYGIKG